MKSAKLKKKKEKPEKTARKKAALEKAKAGQASKGKPEKKLRVLILEDSAVDAELMARQLRRDKIPFQAQRTETRAGFLKALEEFPPDVILADYTLPEFDALLALKLAREKFPLLPFIVVTGSIGEEKAVACLRLGADDYLLKDRLARLGEAVNHAVTSHRLQAERAAIEAAMERAAERWRTTFDSMNDAVCMLDEKGVVQQCNRAMNRLLGLPFKRIIGRDCLELFCGVQKRDSCACTLALRDGRRHEEETFWRDRWYQVAVDPIVDGERVVRGAVHVMIDITLAKESENRFRESAAKLSQAQRIGRLGSWEWNLEGNTLEWSEELYRIWGVDRDFPLTFDGIAAMIHPDDQAANQAMVQQLLSERDESGWEFRILCPDGAVKHIHQHIEVTRAPSGQAVRMFGIMQDISERRRAEELLHERDQLLQNLSAQIPGMIYTFLRRPDGRYSIPYCSAVIQDNFGVTARDVYEDAAPIFAAIFAEDRPRVTAAIEESARTLSTWQQEFRVQQPGQPLRWLWGKSEPFRLADGSVLWYGFNAEITERKQAEEKLRDSLQEKEVLLKEIHHRVKNNLQVISGLLTLQAQQIDDARLQHVIKDSQSRIWTMALIHQTLYQSGNLAAIDMAEYIRGLTGNLLSSHAQVAMPPTIHFDLLPLRLAIDKAIPLALILNELLTNAMKHAFPDGRTGEIRISLREGRDVKFYAPAENAGTDTCTEPAHPAPAYELAIADNGAGLPRGFDPQSQKSLGLQLVAMLARQLEGALAIESAGGTIVTITFNLHGKSQEKT